MDDRRDFWIRPLTLALLGLAWVGSTPRAANAIGCHAPDRPSLGLPILGEAIDRLSQPRVETDHRAASITIIRGFCLGDIPAPQSARVASGSSHSSCAVEAVRADRSPIADRFHFEPVSPIRSIHLSNRIDRPPRRLATLIG